MDGISLDRILEELRPRLQARYARRLDLVAEHALSIEISGEHKARLILDAARGSAGIGLVDRTTVRELADDAMVPGRERHGLLLFRKHVAGRRFDALERIAGERTLVFTLGDSRLALRLSGPAPAITLVQHETAIATLGEGPPVWPLPLPRPEREWDRIDLLELSRVALQTSPGRARARAVLAACPSLGPALAAATDGTAPALEALRGRLRNPRPVLRLVRPPEECRDVDLTASDAVTLLPILPDETDRFLLRPGSWIEAASILLALRRRGRRFDRCRRAAWNAAQREIRRLERLATRLAQDRAGLADENVLRFRAEALLAWRGTPRPGENVVSVPDPRHEGSSLRIEIDLRLSAPLNANRIYEKARRIERAREQIGRRLAETRAAIARMREGEASVSNARDRMDLCAAATPGRTAKAALAGRTGVRRFRTSRGLTLLVGRRARENRRITFGVASPDDHWLHVRDGAGAHVILRDPDGRASADDLREAAEVAAFYSDLQQAAKVDVHVTRRKHLRSAGASGRVRISHSETLRVSPSNPEGRLRRF